MAKYICIPSAGIEPCDPELFKVKGYADGWNKLYEILQGMPEAKVEPKLDGEWIRANEHGRYKCGQCGAETMVDECMGVPMYAFCPYCNAAMIWQGKRIT